MKPRSRSLILLMLGVFIITPMLRAENKSDRAADRETRKRQFLSGPVFRETTRDPKRLKHHKQKADEMMKSSKK